MNVRVCKSRLTDITQVIKGRNKCGIMALNNRWFGEHMLSILNISTYYEKFMAETKLCE